MGWMTQLLHPENKSSSSYSSETSFDSGMSDNANASQSVFAAQSEVRILSSTVQTVCRITGYRVDV